jgi:uncharacterized membrane protein
MSYLTIRLLHLLGAAVLFGTGIGIAFFAWFGSRKAIRQNDIGLMRGVLALTVTADAVFTATAAIAQPLTGYALWRMTGGTASGTWLWTVLAVYAFVGACWLPVVWLQMRLRDAALAAPSVNELDATFHRRFAAWFMLGWPAFAAVLALFGLMLARGYFS